MLNRWRITSRGLGRLTALLPPNRRAIERWVAKTAIDPETQAFIIESLESKDIGTIVLRIHGSRAVLEVSIWKPKFSNRGYDEDAVRVLVDGAFRVLPLTRIELLVFTDELRAIRRFEGVGFRKEGVLRHFEYARGRAHDMLLMSILHEEWKQKSRS